MNKKQIEKIAEKYVTFQIVTNNFESGMLNSNKIDFPCEGLLRIRSDQDILIQVKDIRLIRGVRL